MPARIAIVGSGPSGCYLAQALLKADSTLEVDLIDRLPVPYGLVRHGVAPDHQGTKAVTRQFARLFERQGAGFIGNLDVGPEGDISLDELRALYDVTVLSTGLSRDRALGIPGEDLPGVIGAGRLTRQWTDHPDADPAPFEPGPRMVLVGNGNVAMDVLRLLAKAETDWEGSDFCPSHAARIAAARIVRIEVIGRSPAHQAKFDPAMLREIARLPGVAFEAHDLGLSEGQETPNLEILRDLPDAPGPRLSVAFRFGWTPERFDGTETLESAIFTRDGETLDLPADSAVTAIGFGDDGRLSRDALTATAQDLATGRLAPGLYAAGWFRRGPTGTIPDNRADAKTVAEAILEDLAAATASDRPGRAALRARFTHLTDYDGWQRIDARETELPPEGRVRAKFKSRDEMLGLARRTTKETS